MRVRHEKDRKNMSRSDLTPLRSSNVGRPAHPTRRGRGVRTLAALALAVVLGACSGSVLETKPVCIKPHGGANYQLAPSYQCETGMDGHVWVNR